MIGCTCGYSGDMPGMMAHLAANGWHPDEITAWTVLYVTDKTKGGLMRIPPWTCRVCGKPSGTCEHTGGHHKPLICYICGAVYGTCPHTK